ncbi:MAG TPA: hypothetical protein VKE49_00560 [Myxococcaceae bacterium]|nr:hypothetical protein [Myxococcaceae bacterium]
MPETIDPKHLDKRTAERYLRDGLLDEKAYERYLKNLPDLSSKANVVETSMADAEAEKPAESDQGTSM